MYLDGKLQNFNFVCSTTVLKRFWKVESVGISKMEHSYYGNFLNTISRNENNRYEVQLPFKENYP